MHLISNRDGVCFLRKKPWSLLKTLPILITRHLPCDYWLQPQAQQYHGSRSYITGQVPQDQQECDIPFCFFLSSLCQTHFTSLWIITTPHQFCPIANTCSLKSSAGAAVQVVPRICSLPTRVNSSEGFFCIQVLREKPESKCQKSILYQAFFFFFPHHFYVYLGNDNNCHFLTQTTYFLVAGKGTNSKGTNYGCKCFSQEQFCGIRTCVYIIGDI